MSPVQKLRAPTRLDMALMLLTALIWASAFVAIRVAVPEAGPVWLAAIRVGLGFVVLLPYAIWRGMVWPSSRRQWILIGGMAVLNMVIPFSLLAWAGKTLDAGVLSLLMGTGPFLALIGSHIMTDDDRLTPRKLVSVTLGFAGILIVVGPSAVAGLGAGSLEAKLAALGASLCYVTAGLLIRKIEMPPVRLACLALGLGTAALIPIALITSGAPPTGLSATTMAALVYLGVFPTGLAYILRFHLIRTIGYSRFSLSINLIPVFGVALGVLLLGEPLSLTLIAALALVLAGLFVAGGGKRPSLPETGGSA
ncbi:MAG: DMT family transporter [Hoeflea sp.]|uniref:DMT family transporter n=1 Tax=Hoeflea sp. TaxID=1940281 RepID=UPI001D7EE459|nr:DMT family transporter [Hoeflea sp.]MBU4529677.1 DMT family transporter [Alphaproteobacteria bacterium]MBU4546796.1 DMT family transporter [Alphaproteobacteria bacterium]MBU4551064.1 DMT family transporter [Alphaproteobacteria bacterium]MBV1724006.1 DMT family transporter [Hoeflea sp.]MBV1763283.1 DMT family transporter [Hoeflea sp.]